MVFDPVGSKWRIWDFHFHTPSSGDYKDKSITNQDIVDKLIENNVSVVVITDHHHIDVERINNLRSLTNKITFFPGIELCSELGSSTPVHYIGIFPDTSNVEELAEKLHVKLDLTTADRAKKKNDAIYTPFEKGASVIREMGGLVSVHAGKKSNSLEVSWFSVNWIHSELSLAG